MGGGELIAIREEQLALIGGEAKTRGLRQQIMRHGDKFAGLAAVEVQEENIVATPKRRRAPVGQNDQIRAHLGREWTDLAGQQIQRVIALVLVAPAAE